MSDDAGDLLNEIANFFSSRLAEHGATPRGVDWNGSESQILRFEQLSKIIAQTETFSINDLGCGYGALLEYLSGRYKQFSYCGIDISPHMISAANELYSERQNARFLISDTPDQMNDYCVASGIFNMRGHIPDKNWVAYIKATIEKMNKASKIGFAFNCLTIYSDKDRMRTDLYYADPCELFDLCKKHYSRNVALLHDYELYEFTILVRKKI